MNSKTTLSESKIAKIVENYPGLPKDYIEYLKNVGWGQAENGHMIYSEPLGPKEVYGDDFDCKDIILLGDDFQGYCFGCDLSLGVYGEV